MLLHVRATRAADVLGVDGLWVELTMDAGELEGKEFEEALKVGGVVGGLIHWIGARGGVARTLMG